MRTPIKTTKKTLDDLGGALDTYWAEVSSGEYKDELWDMDHATNTILLDHAEGAAMFLNCLNGEIDNVEETMCEEPEIYNRLYRIRKRLRTLEAKVLERFADQIYQDGYGCWKEGQA
jgi:hypothetical protein